MLSLRTRILFLFLFFFTTAFSQKLKKSDKAVIASLQRHIAFLADDKLEGRRAGTPGEKMAMDYIIEQFRVIGLIPKGTESWPQAFPINEGKQIDPSTYFLINNTALI